MDTMKKMGERLKRLKWYYITLIIIASLYLLMNTIIVWAPMTRIGMLLIGLLVWALLIGSVIFLILTIVESTALNKIKPEYRFNVQYIVASVLLGVLGFFVLLSFVVVSGRGHGSPNITNRGAGVKMITWLITALSVGGIILFYVLSLQKAIGSLKDISNIEKF
ncbi:MAG: hypothetical protein HRT98_00045 [Mycoplasmatales bacterium]|nr:hypothetical protein [Mycoplasmatales bacterium]